MTVARHKQRGCCAVLARARPLGHGIGADRNHHRQHSRAKLSQKSPRSFLLYETLTLLDCGECGDCGSAPSYYARGAGCPSVNRCGSIAVTSTSFNPEMEADRTLRKRLLRYLLIPSGEHMRALGIGVPRAQ